MFLARQRQCCNSRACPFGYTGCLLRNVMGTFIRMSESCKGIVPTLSARALVSTLVHGVYVCLLCRRWLSMSVCMCVCRVLDPLLLQLICVDVCVLRSSCKGARDRRKIKLSERRAPSPFITYGTNLPSSLLPIILNLACFYPHQLSIRDALTCLFRDRHQSGAETATNVPYDSSTKPEKSYDSHKDIEFPEVPRIRDPGEPIGSGIRKDR